MLTRGRDASTLDNRTARVTLILTAWLALTVHAQELQPPEACSSLPVDSANQVRPNRVQLEEVIVTARRLQENEQRVPVVVTTLPPSNSIDTTCRHWKRPPQ